MINKNKMNEKEIKKREEILKIDLEARLETLYARVPRTQTIQCIIDVHQYRYFKMVGNYYEPQEQRDKLNPVNFIG